MLRVEYSIALYRKKIYWNTATIHRNYTLCYFCENFLIKIESFSIKNIYNVNSKLASDFNCFGITVLYLHIFGHLDMARGENWLLKHKHTFIDIIPQPQ